MCPRESDVTIIGLLENTAEPGVFPGQGSTTITTGTGISYADLVIALHTNPGQDLPTAVNVSYASGTSLENWMVSPLSTDLCDGGVDATFTFDATVDNPDTGVQIDQAIVGSGIEVGGTSFSFVRVTPLAVLGSVSVEVTYGASELSDQWVQTRNIFVNRATNTGVGVHTILDCTTASPTNGQFLYVFFNTYTFFMNSDVSGAEHTIFVETRDESHDVCCRTSDPSFPVSCFPGPVPGDFIGWAEVSAGVYDLFFSSPTASHGTIDDVRQYDCRL